MTDYIGIKSDRWPALDALLKQPPRIHGKYKIYEFASQLLNVSMNDKDGNSHVFRHLAFDVETGHWHLFDVERNIAAADFGPCRTYAT